MFLVAKLQKVHLSGVYCPPAQLVSYFIFFITLGVLLQLLLSCYKQMLWSR